MGIFRDTLMGIFGDTLSCMFPDQNPPPRKLRKLGNGMILIWDSALGEAAVARFPDFPEFPGFPIFTYFTAP